MSQDLKAEVAQLKKQVAELSKTKDYLEIWKLQSRYAHLYFMMRNSEIPSLFAQKTPGISMDIEDAGIYEGMKGVKRFWNTVLSEERYKSTPGWLAIHMTCNPIIEINKAGTKARGLWFSHGSVSGLRKGKLDCMSCLGKYDMDYVKEDGEWKFFRLAYSASPTVSSTCTPSTRTGWRNRLQAASLVCRITRQTNRLPTTCPTAATV